METGCRADAFILATGHSARDIYQLFQDKKKEIHAKPFALGLRVEHPQELINSIQYHYMREQGPRVAGLPPAAYQLIHTENQRSVFSFCMCPGGIIAPASTGPGELVVNGWSPSKRNNPFANSGIVVNIEEKDWQAFSNHGALAAMYLSISHRTKSFCSGRRFIQGTRTKTYGFCGRENFRHLCQPVPILPDYSRQISPEIFPKISAEACNRHFRLSIKK